MLTLFLHHTIWSYHTLALPQIFRLFWIPQRSPLKSIHEKKNTCQIILPKKIPQSIIPITWNSEYPPGGPSHLTYSENPSGYHRYRALRLSKCFCRTQPWNGYQCIFVVQRVLLAFPAFFYSHGHLHSFSNHRKDRGKTNCHQCAGH